MRRAKVAQICHQTGNLCAVEFLRGHRKVDSTSQYLGLEMEDALAMVGPVESDA